MPTKKKTKEPWDKPRTQEGEPYETDRVEQGLREKVPPKKRAGNIPAWSTI